MSDNMMKYINDGNEHIMQTYGRYDIVLEQGKDVYLYDVNNKEYIDFGSGIAVFALGYSNTKYKEALKSQVDKLIHTSNYYYNIPNIQAAKKLAKVIGMDRVFFTNSGTEAIEGAIKLARKYYYNKHGVGDSNIIAMEHSFHGRSLGALSITGNKNYREPFEPLFQGVKFATFNDINSVKACMDSKTAAIVLEVIQGEGGIHVATDDFIKEIRSLCDQHDIVLILDEIQCGMARTGAMFSYEHYGIKPDIVTTAKALGCGVPVGAFCAVEKVASAFTFGDHGSTYGGNPLATTAVGTVLDIMKEDGIVEHVQVIASYLKMKLVELSVKYDIVKEVRGKGLMLGMEFTVAIKPILKECLDKGLVLFGADCNTIRFLPPLIIEEKHVDKMIVILEQILNEYSKK